jgi:ElaB/YqjD/DUF883 family membrane-anchored ribosome-binding protein
VRLRIETVIPLVLCVGLVGCTATESRRAKDKETPIRSEDVRVNAEQLRLRMRSLVGPMCGQIEQSADSIMSETSDSNLELAALKWKMDAVPTMRAALFLPDPYMAAFDTGVLCVQMIAYFETGPGKEALGPASAKAAADCRRMAEQYYQVIASGTASGDISRGRQLVEQWAAEHPIRYSISGRESALGRVFEQEFRSSRTASQYVADAAASADDLSRKMDVYSDQLFRQARWEGDRLRLELVRDYRVDQVLPLAERAARSAEQAGQTVDHLAPSIDRALYVAQNVPNIIASERAIAVKALHDEMSRTLQDIDNERIAALDQVSKDTSNALKELREALADQSRQLTERADQIATRQIDYVLQHVTRLLMIAFAAVAGVALLGLLVLRWVLAAARRRA